MDIRTELARIPDPRINRYKKHNLVDILLLYIVAMVCGMDNTEKYGKRKLSLNRKRLYASYKPAFLLKILCDL